MFQKLNRFQNGTSSIFTILPTSTKWSIPLFAYAERAFLFLLNIQYTIRSEYSFDDFDK